MVEPDATESPLDAVSAGDRAIDAFEALANETRLAILVALWERYDPFEDDTAVRFSDLRARVGAADSGRFNYHLDRLEGQFVESTDGGYDLTEAGLKFVRSVLAGAGIEAPALEPTEVDTDCKLCGGAVEVAYEDGWVHVLCTECDGLWPDESGRSRGHLAKFSLDPAGLANRSPEEVYAAAWVRSFQKIYSMIEGVCPTCSGRVERSLALCAEHEDEGQCSNCGRRAGTVARLRCTVCKEGARGTMGVVAKYHPAVVAFCYERDLELQYGFNDLAHIGDRLDRARSEIERLSEDPPRVRVTTELDGDEIGLELDERLNVLDVDR